MPHDVTDEHPEDRVVHRALRITEHFNPGWLVAREAIWAYVPLAQFAKEGERLPCTVDRLMWESVIRYAQQQINDMVEFDATHKA